MRLTYVNVKRYRQLENVELDIPGLTVLIGPNGSGKTTLLRAIDYAFKGEGAFEVQHARGVASLRSQLVTSGVPLVEFTVQIEDEDIVQFQVSAKLPRSDPKEVKARLFTFERRGVVGEGGLLEAGQPTLLKARTLDGKEEGLDSRFGQWLFQHFAKAFLIVVAERNLGAEHDNTGQIAQADGRTLMHRLFKAENDRDFGLEPEFLRFQRCMRNIFPDILRFKTATRNGNYDLDFGTITSRWVGGGHRELAVLIGEIALSPSRIVGVEEPERSLHPGLIRHFLECLQTEFSERQFILATHSPVIVGAVPFDQTWEFQGGPKPKRMTKDEAPALAERLGIRTADSLDCVLLHFVEGTTDAAAWNAWFEIAGLADTCRAIDIEGYGTIKHVVNATILEARRQHPIVCVALDGDLRRKPDGHDKITKAKVFAKKMKGKALDLSEDTLEDYLLDAQAIADAFKSDRNSIETWIREASKAWSERNQIGTGAKWVLEQVLHKVGEIRYKAEHAAKIAANIPKTRWHKDISTGIQSITDLVKKRMK